MMVLVGTLLYEYMIFSVIQGLVRAACQEGSSRGDVLGDRVKVRVGWGRVEI